MWDRGKGCSSDTPQKPQTPPSFVLAKINLRYSVYIFSSYTNLIKNTDWNKHINQWWKHLNPKVVVKRSTWEQSYIRCSQLSYCFQQPTQGRQQVPPGSGQLCHVLQQSCSELPHPQVRDRASCAARGTAAGFEMPPRQLWQKSSASGLYRVCRCCRTSLSVARVAVMYCPQRKVVAIFFSFISVRTGVVYFLLVREWATLFLCSDALQL